MENCNTINTVKVTSLKVGRKRCENSEKKFCEKFLDYSRRRWHLRELWDRGTNPDQSYIYIYSFPIGSSACNAGDLDSIPGSGRYPGEGNGHPLQYSCLENSMDREAWLATDHGVAKSWMWLSSTGTHRYNTLSNLGLCILFFSRSLRNRMNEFRYPMSKVKSTCWLERIICFL